MIQAVVFDWFGTLARWADGARWGYSSILTSHGVDVEEAVLDAYHLSWDGIAHPEHSTSREAYLAWTRGRLAELVASCGVAPAEVPELVERLLESDLRTPMVAYPETLAVLDELRRRGLRVAVCSNWGWDLDPFLSSTGIAPYVEVPVTSAQAGYRKPHPAIYAATLSALGVAAPDAVFVGDSWGPDVLGPISAGMRSVHVRRDPSAPAPELIESSARIASLEELLETEMLEPGPRAWSLESGSARAAVGPDGERDEDRHDAGEPHGALPGVQREWPAEREGAHLVDDDGDGLVLGERLQPARHRRDGDEGGAHEREREQPDEAE